MDRELVQGEVPVVNGHGPSLGDVFQSHVQQFNCRLIRGKAVSVFRDLPERIIYGFDGVGGVDDLPDFLGIGEERNHTGQLARQDFPIMGYRLSQVRSNSVSASSACSTARAQKGRCRNLPFANRHFPSSPSLIKIEELRGVSYFAATTPSPFVIFRTTADFSAFHAKGTAFPFRVTAEGRDGVPRVSSQSSQAL